MSVLHIKVQKYIRTYTHARTQKTQNNEFIQLFVMNGKSFANENERFFFVCSFATLNM